MLCDELSSLSSYIVYQGIMRLPLRVLRNGLGVCYHGLLFMPFLIEDVEHGALIVDLSLRYVDWVLFVLHRTIAYAQGTGNEHGP